jgi:hypothetical protein
MSQIIITIESLYTKRERAKRKRAKRKRAKRKRAKRKRESTRYSERERRKRERKREREREERERRKREKKERRKREEREKKERRKREEREKKERRKRIHHGRSLQYTMAKKNKAAGKDGKAPPKAAEETTKQSAVESTLAERKNRKNGESVSEVEINDDDEQVVAAAVDGEENEPQEPEIKLYKSTRIKGYITLVVASIINFDAAQKSKNAKATNVVPSTLGQRRYAISVALVSLILSSAVLLMHLDRITPFKKAWTSAFQPKSKIELALAVFQVLWWSVAVGVETSLQGIAGDGKSQFSLYYR